MNHRHKALKLSVYELTRDCVAQAAMLIAVAIFQKVGTKNMRRAKLVGAIRAILSTVKRGIVLKHSVNIMVARKYPAIMKSIVEYRLVIAPTLVQGDGSR